MDLRHLAALFPSDPAAWQGALPSAGLFPYDLRARFRVRLGGLFAAADRARPRAAQRLGPSTRPYEPGDAFKDLSLPLLARLGEYHTRVDNAPGRAGALVVVHLYANMAYGSPEGAVLKGQTALAAAGLVECAHAGAMHGITLLACTSPDLPSFLADNEARISRSRWLWVITDGLFDPRLPEGGLETVCPLIAPRPALKTTLLLVRDPRELPIRRGVGSAVVGSAHLKPFVAPASSVTTVRATIKETAPSAAGEGPNATRFSGEEYERALAHQLDVLTATSLRVGFGRVIVPPALEVETFAREIAPLC